MIGALTLYAFLGSSRQLSVGPESTTALMTAAALATIAGAGSDRPATPPRSRCWWPAFCVLGLAAPVGRAGRPVVPPGPGRLPRRHRRDHGGLAARQAAGRARGRRRLLRRAPPGAGPARPGAWADGGAQPGHADRDAGRRRRRPPGARRAARHARCHRSRRDARPVRGRGAAGRHDPRGRARARPPRRRHGRADRHAGARRSGSPSSRYTDNILTGRAFAARHGQTIDPQRELLALGAANLGAGLLHGFPVSSSGSRTAIADAVGGRTQLAGLVTVGCTLAGAAHPAARSWPRSRSPRSPPSSCTPPPGSSTYPSWSGSPGSAAASCVLALATTAGVLVLDVLLGILVAIALSVLDLLRRVARPHDAVEGTVPGLAGMHDVDDYPTAEEVPGLLVYRYDSPLFFANAENFRTRALAAVDDADDPSPLVPAQRRGERRGRHHRAPTHWSSFAPSSTGAGSSSPWPASSRTCATSSSRTGLLDRIGEDHIFPTLPTAWRATTTGRAPSRLSPSRR